jgi:hypothetical protein
MTHSLATVGRIRVCLQWPQPGWDYSTRGDPRRLHDGLLTYLFGKGRHNSLDTTRRGALQLEIE